MSLEGRRQRASSPSLSAGQRASSPSLFAGVVDGLYDLVSRFETSNSYLPGCTNSPCSRLRKARPSSLPRYLGQRDFSPFRTSAPSSPRPHPVAQERETGSFLDRCTPALPMQAESSIFKESRSMTPYGPAPPSAAFEGTASRRATSRDARTMGTGGAMATTPYGPAPVQTPYGPAPSGNTPRQQQRAQSADPRCGSSNGSSVDLIDQNVQQFLRCHPALLEMRRVLRKSRGIYSVDGREVTIELDYGCINLTGGQGCLMVQDGPMRQPFSDYVEKKDGSAVYCTENLRRSHLQMLDKDTRMSFKDADDRYSRLDAMKVAKEQAHFREKAAEYANAGHMVPSDLWQKYEKAVDIKLGRQRGCNKVKSEDAQQPGVQLCPTMSNCAPTRQPGVQPEESNLPPVPPAGVCAAEATPQPKSSNKPGLTIPQLTLPQPPELSLTDRVLFGTGSTMPKPIWSSAESNIFNNPVWSSAESSIFSQPGMAADSNRFKPDGYAYSNRFKSPDLNLFGGVPNFIEEAKGRMNMWPQPACSRMQPGVKGGA